MAKAKETKPELTELKEKIQGKKTIFGFESVMKSLRKKSVKKIYLASNCPKKIRDEIERYSTLANISVITLDMNNENLAVFCKKPFFVSVIGIT